MKRSIIIFSAIFVLIQLCCNTTWAGPIAAHEVQQAVTGWLRLDPQPLETILGVQVAKVETFNDKNGEPIYYVVYLEPAGFVIMPADDLVEPIVCFADDGRYDPSPDNCLGALVTNDLNGRIATVRDVKSLEAHGRMQEALKSQVKWGQLISLADSGEEEVVIEGLGSISDVRRSPLVQSQWSQSTACGGNCYNYYTPNNYVCGCVATAMAQIIRYYQYPTSGIGVNERTIQVDGVEQTASTRGGDGAGGPYNWSQMPLVPNSNCPLTTTQRQAIGALCFDAGVSVNMTYTSGGSAAYADMPKYALTGIFQYYGAIVGYESSGIGISPGLLEMINPNLDAHSPVQLGISRTGGGHAVVCDGYGYHSSTMYHHINMGWAGVDDAWYNLPNVSLYDTIVACIYNIRPTGDGDGEVISGRVLYANGAPIPNATVYVGLNPPPPPPPPPPPSMGGLESQSASFPVITSTDSKGIYAFSDLNSNTTYYVTSSVRGYVPLTYPVHVGESQNNHATSGNVWGADFVPTRLDYLYVDDDAPGDPGPGDPTVSDPLEDGSVQHPFDSIQEAIVVAINGNEIEVSPGTYNEAINFNGKAIHLYSTAGPNDTTIDGTGNNHVVQCRNGEGANTIFEGFTITGGYANGGWPDNNGGGMFNAGSSPTVTNCIFTGNRGHIDGGGMYNRVGSNPTVTNCIFKGNTAINGSGMLNIASSSPTLADCTFISNTANLDGGGMYNYDNSSPTITNCKFSGNNAATNGGGMWNGSGSNPSVTNCRFSGNEAGSYGGGMYNDVSLPKLTNCIFNHNEAVQASGGGIANYNSSDSTVTNCTFSGNKTIGGGGGGIRNWDSSPTVTNCILWDNEPDEISSAGASAPAVNYSDIQGGWGGAGNINAEPCFVDPNNPDPNLQNLRLKPDSPCIDAGDTTVVTGPLDSDGNPRVIDDPHTPNTGLSISGSLNMVDMGVYEFQPCRIAGDINCDGVVDFKDVAILCNNWLAGTEPEL
jgi:parallel beta-helix repeat protein